MMSERCGHDVRDMWSWCQRITERCVHGVRGMVMMSEVCSKMKVLTLVLPVML